MLFSGLSAFPLTPMNESGIDEMGFIRLVERLATAKVDSISVLGSTGSYAYLTHSERKRIAELSVQHADSVPVIVGVGAIRTRDVLELAEHAQLIGASGVLLAPVSYQKLTESEVLNLYQSVTENLSIPLCVYDTPATTQFTFSDQLHGRIAQLPNVASIKLPDVPADFEQARARVQRLRALLPAKVTIGVSTDGLTAAGLNAGCEVWYSVIGGLLPELALAISRAAQAGNAQQVTELCNQLAPLWSLFAEFGSLRVTASLAAILGLVSSDSLPLPVMPLMTEDRQRLLRVVEQLQAVLALQ